MGFDVNQLGFESQLGLLLYVIDGVLKFRLFGVKVSGLEKVVYEFGWLWVGLGVWEIGCNEFSFNYNEFGLKKLGLGWINGLSGRVGL